MRATRLIGFGIFVILLLVACGTGGGGTTPPPSSGLQITVSGLPDDADANIRVLGPDGYQAKVTQDGTLSSLAAGPYEVIASMVSAASGDVYAASDASTTVSITATSGARVDVAYETEPAILTDDAVVLSSETVAALSSFTPAGGSALRTQQVAGGDLPYGEFEFSVDTENLQDLVVGDVFSVGATPEAPYGAIGRVTDIDRSGSTVRVRTSEARLSDAVERGRGIATQEVSPDTILTEQSVSPTLHVQSLAPMQDGRKCLAMNGSLAIDADSGQVVLGAGDTNADVRGEYCIDPRPMQLALEVRDGELFIETIVEWSTTNSLAIEFSQELGFDADFIPLHTIVLKPVTFFVGPVPVVLLPEIQIGVDLEGGVVGGVTIGLTETSTMTVGARVHGNDFEPIFALDKDYTPNLTHQLGVQASFGAGVKARFMLYGVTGGTLKFGAEAHYEADAVSREWALTALLDPTIGWDFNVLVYKVSANWHLLKETLTHPIASGTVEDRQTPVILSVDATRIDGGSKVKYTWEIDPNGSTADSWLWVWMEDPQRPSFPQFETHPYALDDCANEYVTCHSPSRVQLEFPSLPATSDGYSGTVYYQAYVGDFQDGGPTADVAVSSSVQSYDYP